MTIFNGIATFFDTLSSANRMSHLMSLSDNELKARGLDRESLKRGFIESLGSR